MEWIELIELTDEILRLRYYPEQRSATGEFGEVTYFRKTEDWQFDKIAKDSPTNYALHACQATRRVDKLNDGMFRKEGLIGWY